MKSLFIKSALETGVLKFSPHRLKSGRMSPYFWQAGAFYAANAILGLGKSYANTVITSGIGYDMFYGPSYKGSSLVTAAAIGMALAGHHDIRFAYNRKEDKDHGEGGIIVGSPITGKALIIDDVVTAGTAVRESVEIIEGEGGEVTGVVVQLDRMERGEGDLSAIDEIREQYGFPVVSIITFADLVEYLRQNRTQQADENLNAMLAYHEQWGVGDLT